MENFIFDKSIEAIIVDIEGTITATSFIQDTLIPYAKSHLQEFIEQEKDNPVIKKLCEEVRVDAKLAHINSNLAFSILNLWMEQNQQFHSLKTLQGLIWEKGFKEGMFKGHIFEDAYKHFCKWHEMGISIYLFSTGSVHFQHLLCQYSNHGDISHLFTGFIDTAIGEKNSVLAYKKIVQTLDCQPQQTVYLSDSFEELNAAKLAGLKTTLVHRSLTAPAISPHPVIRNFDEIKYANENILVEV